MMIGTFVTDTGRLPLCNFYESPDGSPLFVAPFFNTAGPVLEWPTAEHYYQAAKATFAVDAELIRTASSPGLAKKIARERAMNRTDWQEVKLSVMRKALELKFQFGTSLGAYLMSTHPMYLREGNTWGDTFWGTTPEGQGANWLGHLLMARRAVLLCQYDESR